MTQSYRVYGSFELGQPAAENVRIYIRIGLETASRGPKIIQDHGNFLESYMRKPERRGQLWQEYS